MACTVKKMDNRVEIFSIGHSTFEYDTFLRLLRKHSINAIADVRSSPFSRRYPHFNRSILKDELRADNIAYAFLGDELGGRPKESQFFCEGVADYEKMALVPDFSKGIERVLDGASRYRIALMCSEHNPLDCHRCLLVGRALKERGASVAHILSNGSLRTHDQVEDDLRAIAGQNQSQTDMLSTADERLASAYRYQARRVAYSTT